MEQSQSPSQGDIEPSQTNEPKEESKIKPSLVNSFNSSNYASKVLGEKIQQIDMKPPAISATYLLAKNAAILQTGITRVNQLRATGSNQSSTSTASSGSATGNPRNKTALGPGYSLMDWIRLGSSGEDLTGVGGKILSVTPAELAQHNKEGDAWMAVRGIVFNVSRYMKFHPGGIPELMKGVGRDATKLFDDVHAWVNYQSILQKCVVGRLVGSISTSNNLTVDSKTDSKKTVPSESARAKPVPDPPTLKMDWRQTSSSITFYYSVDQNVNHIADCRITRIDDLHVSVGIALEKTRQFEVHELKFEQELEWPPNCQRCTDSSELEISFKKKSRSIWKKYGSDAVSKRKYEPSERRYTEYEIVENRQLCKVVYFLVLRARNYIQIIPPGRHVEVKMDVLGTEVSRMYTPVPSCFQSDGKPESIIGDDCICLIVKRYENGALTPSLTGTKAGDRLILSNGLGKFTAELFDSFGSLHMISAGTGLTAMLPIIYRALRKKCLPTINLINFNRNEDHIFYRCELEELSKDGKLSVTHVLSEAKDSWTGRRATVSDSLLEELMGKGSPKSCVFTCGPPRFLVETRRSLENLGWQSSQMHEFDE